MKIALRNTLAVVSLAAALGAFALPAAAQSDSHDHGQQGMGGMMGCPMMGGGMSGGDHGMPHLPPGNEKLELQMHADMMKAMADVLAKYAARLPDRK